MTAQSNSQNVKVGIEQGAARMFVKAGGVLDIEAGGAFAQNGQVSEVRPRPAHHRDGRRHRPDGTCDGRCRGCLPRIRSDRQPFHGQAQIGDQAGAPAAGSIIIKTWQNTGGADPTPAAATTFGKKVNWIAIGT